jgi:hypothetical protein
MLDLLRRALEAASQLVHTPVVLPPPPPAFRLGMNVHQLTPEHLSECLALGIRQVRTTMYVSDEWTPERVATVRAWVDAGIELLVVVHDGNPSGWVQRVVTGARLFPELLWQIGNEDEGRFTPMEYGRIFTEVQIAVPAGTKLVASAPGGDPAYFVRSGIRPHAFAVHAYGPPPVTALALRAPELKTDVPVWCTEFGISPLDIRRAWPFDDPAQDDTRIAAEWQEFAEAAPHYVKRAYGYCLDRDEGAQYGIPDTVRAFLRASQGGR